MHRLRAFYSRDELCRLASEKDRGFDSQMFGAALARILRFERRDFPVEDRTDDALRREFTGWLHDLAQSRSPRPPTRDLGLERDPPGPSLHL